MEIDAVVGTVLEEALATGHKQSHTTLSLLLTHEYIHSNLLSCC